MQIKVGQVWENPHGSFFVIAKTNTFFTDILIGQNLIKHSYHTNFLANELITEDGYVLSKKHIIQEFFKDL